MEKYPPAIFLMGPTASGKTDLAVKLAQQLPCDIVSVDSAMVYREMNVGTAKPEKDLLAVAPHRLIDICDPSEPYSAAEFRRDALQEMENIVAKGRIPLLVGGTMLYFRALEQGLSVLPEADPEIRSRLEQQAEANKWKALHERLAQIDPQSASRIHPNDPQRIQRALEVYEISSVSMSELFERKTAQRLPYRIIKIAIVPSDREILRDRIAKRFNIMLQQGFIEEVERLYNRGDLTVDLPSMRAAGYRQVWEYLEGKLDYDNMVQRAVVVTRQLAKRQLTWLRAEQDVIRLDGLDTNLFYKVLNILNRVTMSK